MGRINQSGRCAAVTLLLLASRAPSQALSYRVTDLGAVPGDSKSVAYGLNDLGQAVGDSSNPSAAVATLFSSGKATSLNTLGADVSVATAIGGSGQAAGYFYTGSTPFHAFLFTGGRMVDIHSASLFPAGSMAFGINSSGQVVGEGKINSYTFHPFLYSGGQMVDIETLGGFQASARAINDSGEITGGTLVPIATSKKTVVYADHAFLFANGRMVDLGVPAGASGSNGNAINGSGQIVGSLTFSSGAPAHAALYSNGVWTDLGAVAGASGTQATGINLSGQIVGTAFFPQVSYEPPIPGKHIGFVIRNGALVDLNTLLASNSGFTITDAVAINGSGQILCDATNSSGVEHAVLLTPG